MFLSSQEEKEYKNVVLNFTVMITSGFWGMLKKTVIIVDRSFRGAAVELVNEIISFFAYRHDDFTWLIRHTSRPVHKNCSKLPTLQGIRLVLQLEWVKACWLITHHGESWELSVVKGKKRHPLSWLEIDNDWRMISHHSLKAEKKNCFFIAIMGKRTSGEVHLTHQHSILL